MFNKNKLSYITGAEINVPDTSIYEYLLMRSRRNGARIISRCHEAELSLERLKSESEIYARAFRKLGVKEGEIVPMCLPPSNEAIIAFFALNRMGAVATFLSVASSREELKNFATGSSWMRPVRCTASGAGRTLPPGRSPFPPTGRGGPDRSIARSGRSEGWSRPPVPAVRSRG